MNVSAKKHKNILIYKEMYVAELIKPERNIIQTGFFAQSTMNYQPFGRTDTVSLLSVQPIKRLYLQ
jgi:hypothetical protein